MLSLCPGPVWLFLDLPALYIETQRAPTNPNACERPARTLKGAKAGFIVRELIDSKTVLGVRCPRLLQIYVENAPEAAIKLNLRETESGTNVVLVEFETQVPFLRSQQRNGQRFAAISQVVADLLSSPGSAPAEAEEPINWMKENEETWRR